MFNWNDQDQVGDTLWGEHKENEDHIVPQPNEHEGNSFSKFGRSSKKQRHEDDSNPMDSAVERSKIKNNFLICNVENSSSINTNQELNDSSADMDTWSDLPNLSMAFRGGLIDGNERDSVVTGMVRNVADASDLKSAGGDMAGYNQSHDQGSSSLTKPRVLTCNEMQLDGENDLFGHDDKENDRFLDYDWANIEDFADLDNMFRNNDSLFGSEMIDNTDAFLSESADLISSTAQSIPVPDLPISREQTWQKSISYHQLEEHFDVKLNPLQKEKTTNVALKAEGQTPSHAYLSSESSGICSQMSHEANKQNQTIGTKRNKEEKGKGGSLQVQNDSWYCKNQQISSPRGQASAMDPLQTFQSQPMEQPSSSPHVMLANYGYHAYQLPAMPLPPQIHAVRNQHNLVPGGFKAYPDCSKHPKPAETAFQPLTMTPQEKIDKLRRRQQMQAMLAIQKQREQYDHQISGVDETPSQACLQNNQNQDATRSTSAVEDYAQKLPSSDVSSLAEQDQPQMISSSLDDGSIEETVYYQLQDAMGKLDMKVRLRIRDSLYRLARSAMERQNASDRSSSNKKTKEEDDISADEESNNQDRHSRMQDSEAVTNPIDRIVAHLLFHNPSRSSLTPTADGNMSMTTSM